VIEGFEMNRIPWLRMLTLASLVACCGIPAPCQETIEVGPVVKSPERSAVLVTKPYVESDFTDKDKIVQEIYELFVFDLQFADAFRIYEETPQAAYLNNKDFENKMVDFGAWKQFQIQDKAMDYLVKTILVPRGTGYLELDLLVYDISTGERVVGMAYGQERPFPINNLRRAGHRATAKIITTLTGDAVTPITETRIAYVNYDTSKQTKELFVMDYDGWEKSLVQITFFNSVTRFPDWSPDGLELTYVSYKNNWPDAYIHHLPSGKVSVLAQFKGTNNTPRWFPDGKRLAISLSAQGNAEIYTITRDGKETKRLTFNRAIDVSPDVSPAGNQIAFISDRVGSPQVYVMDVDGANLRRISYIERKCDTPFWSPVPIDNDYRIVFASLSGGGQADIYTVRPDGTDANMLTDGIGTNLNPTWSPDGKYIAFSSTRLGKAEIFLTSARPDSLLPNGKKIHRLTFLPGENLSPAWSPN